MTATTSNQANFFNLHVSAVGYLNRIRWVEVKQAGRRAEPFLACSVAALRGNAEKPDYTYFDLRVSGGEAQEICDKLIDDVKAQRKVFITCKLGDIFPHQYERDVKDGEGRKTGEKESACLIKGRLLQINTVTVDGERVYTREVEEHAVGESLPPAGDDAADASAQQQASADADVATAALAAARQSAKPARQAPIKGDAEPQQSRLRSSFANKQAAHA
jgi:hypothetical protein